VFAPARLTRFGRQSEPFAGFALGHLVRQPGERRQVKSWVSPPGFLRERSSGGSDCGRLGPLDKNATGGDAERGPNLGLGRPFGLSWRLGSGAPWIPRASSVG